MQIYIISFIIKEKRPFLLENIKIPFTFAFRGLVKGIK
ncbi:hypothetical protein EV202_105123 [Bacteroides heparinolyticus]|uniref:Uncharacterized protein n=1 Tax=Prevotella heparinolytica TaxID=28113 RepID=A0A449I2Y1_9BACE|nr:hypothetical protein EV202_105123 [Bacteroides heparinolyticus]VFB13677.1 Uncharacterised protein [Bacteroides heparinolyticus]